MCIRDRYIMMRKATAHTKPAMATTAPHTFHAPCFLPKSAPTRATTRAMTATTRAARESPVNSDTVAGLAIATFGWVGSK